MSIDVTITYAMIEAGKKALSQRDSGFWSRGGTDEAVLLKDIYRAMALARIAGDSPAEGGRT